MRILVTGCAGYIGSVTSELLLERGIEVLGVDDLSSGHRSAVPDGVDFAELDVLDTGALTELLSRSRCDAAFHFAAEVHIPVAMRDPGRAWRQNVEGTRSLCDALANAGVKRLVFSSTCAVYGSPATFPINEDTPREPINPYGASKLAAEQLLVGFNVAYGLEYVALRYFNVCGATEARGEDRAKAPRIMPIALDVALGRQKELVVYGKDYPTADGTCVRDYVHVSDIAAAHLAALERLGTLPRRAYNLGIGRGFSVLDVVGAVERESGKKVPLTFGPRRDGDPAELVADASAFARDAGFSPRVTELEVMVRDALAFRTTTEE